MSTHEGDGLTTRHRAAIARTAGILDVERGLADAHHRVRHADSVAATGRRLDVERGLRAALDRVTATPPRGRSRRARATPWARSLSDRLSVLTPGSRLAFRVDGRVALRHASLVRALDLCADIDGAACAARRLVECVDSVAPRAVLDAAQDVAGRLDLLRDLVHDSGLDVSSALDRCRRIDLGRGLDVAADLVAAVAYGLGPRSTTGVAHTREMAHDLDRELGRHALCEISDAVARAHGESLAEGLGLRGSCDGTPADAASVELLQRALVRAANDFVDADLTSVSLGGVSLEGMQWSVTTRWPVGWESVVRGRSIEVRPGLFEVRRSGAARRGAEVAT